MNVLQRCDGYVRLVGFDAVKKAGRAVIKPGVTALIIDSRPVDRKINPDRIECPVINGCIRDKKALALIDFRCEAKNTVFYELEGFSYIQVKAIHLPDDWEDVAE